MIKKITSIRNLGIYRGFEWDAEVRSQDGQILDLKEINILYGRNYSGKTTLSRIFRAMETGYLSEKYEMPSFEIELGNGQKFDQSNLKDHGLVIRVFNEDFVTKNLRFITNPEEDIEPFAILGEDNNRLEAEIRDLAAKLGASDEGAETGLHADSNHAAAESASAKKTLASAEADLEAKIKKEATNRQSGIKYRSDLYGDQNYDTGKLKAELQTVSVAEYSPLSDDAKAANERLLKESALPIVQPGALEQWHLDRIIVQARELLGRSVGEAGKIAELAREATLHRWVGEGRTLHKEKRENCAFCGNPITEERWAELERHFDEESEKLEKELDTLIQLIEERIKNETALVDRNRLYSKFHAAYDDLASKIKTARKEARGSMESILNQLRTRKSQILVPQELILSGAQSNDLMEAWKAYVQLCSDSNEYSESLETDQAEARRNLRLNRVHEFSETIQYHGAKERIAELRKDCNTKDETKQKILAQMNEIRDQIAAKKRQMNDEEKGALKVNEYLNHYCGHDSLKLEAKKEEETAEGGPGRVRFQVIRDGRKAYHLSEGERSLLAFCYFLAKLADVETKNSKPIIWIDDPISSLDSNHIFFVYSLIRERIIKESLHSQLFVSTHSLDLLKYCKRFPGASEDKRKKESKKRYQYLNIERNHKKAGLLPMPRHMRDYVTEFNYLFQQIHSCASIGAVNAENFTTFYNFGNNARKFMEIYLYYRFPDQGMTEETLLQFFGDSIPAALSDRINNEYSHLCGIFERGSTPVEAPEMQLAARLILQKLEESDSAQYQSLLSSIGAAVVTTPMGKNPK